MSSLTGWLAAAGVVTASFLQGPHEQAGKQKRPEGWAVLQDEDGGGHKPLFFVDMPPGWHITTGAGTILYRPDQRAQGKFRVEATFHLFPGESTGGYGIFIHGRHLDDPERRAYDALLLRRDGTLTIAHVSKSRQQGPWQPYDAIVKGKDDGPVKNVVTVDVDANVARVLVNGKELLRHEVSNHVAGSTPGPWDGIAGLRLDAGTDVHVSSFEIR